MKPPAFEICGQKANTETEETGKSTEYFTVQIQAGVEHFKGSSREL